MQKLHQILVHIWGGHFYYETGAKMRFFPKCGQQDQCVCIYIYVCVCVVKLLAGPSLAILGVIIWAK